MKNIFQMIYLGCVLSNHKKTLGIEKESNGIKNEDCCFLWKFIYLLDGIRRNNQINKILKGINDIHYALNCL